MSFKNFSQLNDFISTTADITDQLNSLVSMCQQGISQLSSIKQISDAYARQYSLVQQIQYDADGNIQDVTSADRLSVPNTVIETAKDTVNRCSLAIKRIKPVDLGNVSANLILKPIAKLYEFNNIGTNDLVQPDAVTVYENYYYTSGEAMYLSNEFIDSLISKVANAQIIYAPNSGVIRAPLVIPLPFHNGTLSSHHQLSLISTISADIYTHDIYLRHTGDFVKYEKLQNVKSKDILNEASYTVPYNMIGGKIQYYCAAPNGGYYTMTNANYLAPGTAIEHVNTDNAHRLKTLDYHYEVASDVTSNMWAILVGLADNGNAIMNILNAL